MLKFPIYLDNHATTQVDPRVLSAMLPYFSENYGNAASQNHAYGKRAAEAVETARAQITKAIGAAAPEEIIFTSGATESNNFAIRGLVHLYRDRGNHLVTSSIEHKSVLEVFHRLETKGFRVTYLNVNRDGLIDLKELEECLTDQTILISVMHANNEIGTLQPVEQIGKIAKTRGIFFHSDGAQSVGKVSVDVEKMGIDLLSISAHKMYGPKGIGALYARRRNPRVRIEPLLYGGGQENGSRPGTLNVPAVVGFGIAADIAVRERLEESKRIQALRNRLMKRILEKVDEVHVNGSMEHRLSGNLNLSFPYVEGGALLSELGESLAVSSGSACTQASLEPSYVLKVLGVEENLIHTSIRFGVGRFNTEEEIDFAADHVVKAVKHLRDLSTLYQTVRKNVIPASAKRRVGSVLKAPFETDPPALCGGKAFGDDRKSDLI